jgi:hypothetical protein
MGHSRGPHEEHGAELFNYFFYFSYKDVLMRADFTYTWPYIFPQEEEEEGKEPAIFPC